jgi:hypothetical protein
MITALGAKPHPAKLFLDAFRVICLNCINLYKKVPAMSKKTKRVQVMLTPEIFEIVEKISAIGGVSISSLLAEIITESKDGLVMILEALQKAKQQDLSGAIDRLQAGLLDGMGQGVELAKQMNEEKTQLQK